MKAPSANNQSTNEPHADADPVVISALNQYVFCPRRCALMHIEGIWADNQHTMLGSLLHNHADEPGYQTDGEVMILRALPIYSVQYGLSGLADIVEFHDQEPVPVEYKKGRKRLFENDDIQLCAQALCLEEMFSAVVSRGYIYHAASRRRREVIIDYRLREETLRTIEAVRKLIKSGKAPLAELKPRCDGCSLRGNCLPEVTAAHSSRERSNYQRSLWGE